VSAVTLAEVLYVASRIYSAVGVEDPNGEAENFAMWIASRARIVGVDARIAKVAGELKRLGAVFAEDYVGAGRSKERAYFDSVGLHPQMP